MRIANRVDRPFLLRQDAPPGAGTTPPATPPPETPPATPPAPQGVTREEFDSIRGTLSTVQETLARFNTLIEQGTARSAAAASAGTEITPEQYEEAIRVGDGAVARKFVEQERAKDRAAVSAELGALRDMGTESISGVIEGTTIATLPYYKKYEKEIKELLKQMPAAGRINPVAQRRAYDMVIGSHVDEIAAEQREQAIRRQTDDAAAARPGSTGSSRAVGASGTPEAPEPTDLSPDAEQALVEVGRDKDRFARGMGYESWKVYMDKTKEYRR